MLNHPIQIVYKRTALDLAKQHRENCNDMDCGISLTMLRIMAEDAGVVFSEDELKEFA